MIDELNSLSDVVSAVSDWSNEKGVWDVWWFRGQPDTSSMPTPKIYREDFVKRANEWKDVGPEKVLHLERMLFQAFKRPAAPFLTGLQTDVEKYFYGQHHGLPTRLVDWTTNLLTALWFAVADVNTASEKKDGYLFALMPELLMKKIPGKIGAFTVAQDDLVKKALSGALWENSGEEPKDMAANIIPLVPDDSVARFAKQSSCFTLHMPSGRSLPTLDETGTWKIPFASKKSIVWDLRRCGVTEFSIFYTPDHLVRELRDKYVI